MRRRPAAKTPLRGLIALLAALCLGWAGALVYLASSNERTRSEPGRPAGLRGSLLPDELTRDRAPRIRLSDARGGTLDSRELAGRPYAVTFLYTRCPDVCPLIGQEVRRALEMLGPSAGEVTVVAVSVDPRGDTPEAVRAWLERQPLPENFRYLIGSEEELRPVWDAYFAAPQTPGRPETSTHTASIWLIGADGRLRTKYSAGVPVSPEDLAHDFRALLGEETGNATDSKEGSQ